MFWEKEESEISGSGAMSNWFDDMLYICYGNESLCREDNGCLKERKKKIIERTMNVVKRHFVDLCYFRLILSRLKGLSQASSDSINEHIHDRPCPYPIETGMQSEIVGFPKKAFFYDYSPHKQVLCPKTSHILQVNRRFACARSECEKQGT